MSENKTVLSSVLKELFNSIGQAYAQSKIDSDKAIDDFKNAVVIEATKEVNGKLEAVKVVDYYLYEQGSLAWKAGYAQKKSIAMYLTDSKLNPTVNTAFSEFMSKVGDRHGIAKPTKPTTEAQNKSESREKAKAEKEVLMSKSYEVLEKVAQELSIKGGKDNMKQAVKVLDIIEAKKKADEKAIEEGFKAKHKLIKELLGNCFNHSDLDVIIEMLEMYKPKEPSVV